MASSTTVIQSKTVLGKRKASGGKAALVLHLAYSPEPTNMPESDDSYQPPATSSPPPILINGRLVPSTKRRYKCTYDSCEKAYTKPSRLIEHERTHTGVVCRPSPNIFTPPNYLFRGRSYAKLVKNLILEKLIYTLMHVPIFLILRSRLCAIKLNATSVSGPLSTSTSIKNGTMERNHSR